MTARPGRIVAPILALALAGGVLTGCSGGSSEPGSSSPSSTSTTATSSTTSTAATTTTTTQSSTSNATYAGAPGVPEEAKYKTDAGAIAFVRHYSDVVEELSRQPGKDSISPLSLPTCKTCTSQTKSLSKLAAQGHHYSSKQADFKSAARLPMAGSTVIRAVYQRHPTTIVDASGNVVKEISVNEEGALVYTLTWQSGWRVAEIQQDKSS